MEKPSKEDIMKKWEADLGSIGETKSEDFQSLLPIATKVSSQMISNQIMGFASEEEIDAVKKKVQSDNRDGKIDSIIEGKEFTEKKVEDDPDYQKLIKKGVTPLSAPSGVLFYIDYQYQDTQKSHKKTRRSKKKKSNG